MKDNLELLKSLDTVMADEDEGVDTPSGLHIDSNGEIIYDEFIPAEMAKHMLGARFIDKPDVKWQLIFEQEDITLVAWVPGEEPTMFTLESDDEVVTLHQLNNMIASPNTIREEVMSFEKEKTSLPWFVISLGAIFVMLFIGFFLLLYLFSLK